MRFYSIGILLTLVMLSFISCKKTNELPNSSINQLRTDGAVLPVHIHGNKNSDVAIVVVHGGPGESGILKRDAVGLYRLEEDHLVVYYDQRASGISEGNVNKESLTIEQMAHDLEAVVELVDEITDVSAIFILSLDWGGAIAATYLTGNTLNPKVNGYIASAPGFNARKNMFAMRDTLQSLANLITINDPEAENVLQNFLNQNLFVNAFNYQEHYRVVDGLLGITFNTNYTTAPVDLPAYTKRSVENNQQYVMENLKFQENHFLFDMDVEPLLPLIPVPTKLIWGSHDLLFPVKLAGDYGEQLGLASDAEQVSIFNFSAHRPYYEEGDRFYATVATWISFFD
ncbi:MAG: alpha/beta hydrolase [Bacteroidetes bacterium]|nr:alpha/beta hydrolase [Bacteroidota bacterium]